MKIKCINNKGYLYITIGKTYEVVSIYADGDYIIINDIGIEDCYYEKWFKPAVSEMRNDKIDKLLE